MKRLLPLVLLVVTTGVQAEGGDWLTQASQAVRTLDYKGVMVYLRNNRVDTLRVVHRYRDGHERERLVSLSGEPREIIRDDGRVTCVLPDRHVVLVARHSRKGLLASVASMDTAKLAANYDIHTAGQQRLAGRMCRVVRVTPRDHYRYGYRLLLDQKTNLPLKLELLRDKHILEQMMFTEISFPADIPDAALTATYNTDAFRQIRHQPVKVSAPAANERGWRVGKLPPGFRLAETGQRPGGSGGTVHQLLFTDGIATVSAFIAPVAEHNAFTGSSTMGAVNAYGRTLKGHQITVVGEVPAATVRSIAEHVKPEQQSADAGK